MYRTRVQPSKVARPTRDDVAKLANISGATVSRVLSGRTDVPISPEARKKVLEAAEKLGYQPNLMARALMTGRTGLIGLWTSLQYSRYRSQVLERMKMILRPTELAMAVTDIDEEYTWDHSFTRALRVPVEGIIAFDASASIEAFARDYDRLAPHTPFVSMGAYWSESKSFVGVDLRAGTDAAMEHLLSTGRRRIVYMAPWNSGLLEWGPRFNGYSAAMKAAGLEPKTMPVKNTFLDGAAIALAEMMEWPEKPDAVLCMNDDIALSLVSALQQLGMRPGHDLAVVGFDGIQETEQCLCPITTVKQPIEEMGTLALKFLQAQVEDPTELRQTVLKPTLVIRDSSKS